MIKIIFFARLRELIDIDELEFELTSGKTNTVQSVMISLAESYSAFSDYLIYENQLLYAVNHEISEASREVKSGDELAFFPPVTGG